MTAGPDGSTGGGAHGLVVTGGAGGTRARLEALAAAAGRADRAADHLARAAASVRRAHAAALGDPAVGRVIAPLTGLAWGRTGVRVWAGHAADLAAALRGAARAYAAADAEASAALRALVLVVGHTLGEGGPLAALLAGAGAAAGGAQALHALVLLRLLRAGPTPVGLALRAATGPAVAGRDDAVGLLARLVSAEGGALPGTLGLPDAATVELLLPGLAAWLLALPPGDQPLVGDPVARVAALVVVAAGAWAALLGAPRRDVRVAPLLPAKGEGRLPQPPAPTGAADLLRQVADLGAEPFPTIGLQRLDHADGTTSWVVAIPGTRSWDLAGGVDPMDNGTNLALVACLPDAMTQAVEEVLLRAGVGPDEPVVLAGHSQGGMVAVRAAAALSGTFTVAAVVTAGSPVGSMPLPAHVPALHLEHAADYVPALDGRPNPDRPTRTTVVRAASPSGGAGRGLAPGDVAGAHGCRGYVETAELVDAGGDRSLDAFGKDLRRALGDSTALATQQRYVVARVPAPAPPGTVDATVAAAAVPVPLGPPPGR